MAEAVAIGMVLPSLSDREGRVIERAPKKTSHVPVVATVPEKHGDEPVARFTLGLSLKRRA